MTRGVVLIYSTAHGWQTIRKKGVGPKLRGLIVVIRVVTAVRTIQRSNGGGTHFILVNGLMESQIYLNLNRRRGFKCFVDTILLRKTARAHVKSALLKMRYRLILLQFVRASISKIILDLLLKRSKVAKPKGILLNVAK
jgi:hypothetical protein